MTGTARAERAQLCSYCTGLVLPGEIITTDGECQSCQRKAASWQPALTGAR